MKLKNLSHNLKFHYTDSTNERCCLDITTLALTEEHKSSYHLQLNEFSLFIQLQKFKTQQVIMNNSLYYAINPKL